MAENLPMVIDQGSDFTAQLIWTDSFDDPVAVVHPCRLDIRGAANQPIASMETDPELPEGETPSISLSTETGLLQLHLPAEQTAAMLPGVYHYDLFATLDAGADSPMPTQVQRLIYGSVTVNKRVTVM